MVMKTYLPNHLYVELYAEMAEAILLEHHGHKIQINQEHENGDISFTEEAQDLFNDYCGLVVDVLERVGICDESDEEEVRYYYVEP
jgi:hypothetical protein